jgi:hypothetical protein
MKKTIFALLLLVSGVLFITKYLANITSESTDKVSVHALNQLIATGNKPIQNQPPTSTQQENTVMSSIQQVTEKALTPSNNSSPVVTKPPIATIKIYDKKTAKEITIETQTLLEALGQAITPQQQEEQKKKAEKFQAFFQKSEKCLSPSDHEARVACGNEYIRAKAKFEDLYQQGKL